MFKRTMLGLTFIAALGAATLATSSQAQAWDNCNTGYGYRTAYYPTYAPAPFVVAPRVVSYPPVYPVYYGHFDDGHHHHDHHHHSGVTFTFGF